MAKKVVLFYSGGMDSTYQLIKDLERGDDVTVAIVRFVNNPAAELEEKCRRKTLTYLEKLFGVTINKIYLTVGVSVDHDCSIERQQLPAFMMLANCVSANIDEIEVSYIKGDKIIPYLHDLEKSFNALKPLQANKNIKLKFPLKCRSKEELVKYFSKRYKKLWNSITWCANPTKADNEYINCGECPACKRMAELGVPVHINKF